MNKWYGKVGYAVSSETKPGVWKPGITERSYYGDIIRNSSKWVTNSHSTNDNSDINTEISIVADPYAYQNFRDIKYVEFMGGLWEVTKVQPQRPRLILTIGGVYNGPQATTA